MASIVCSAQPMFGLGRLFSKPAAPPTQPLTPTLGARAPQQRLQQSNAMSLNAGDMQPQNIFSAFVHPDVPAERKPQQPRQKVTVVKPEEGEEENFQSKLGKPRFRSALEQVSYLTNESAMRR